MLEEWHLLFKEAGVPLESSTGVIVQYFNGHSIQNIEYNMPIEASFSWRLLFNYCLKNTSITPFDQWMTADYLPGNANELTLRLACQTIAKYHFQLTQQNTTTTTISTTSTTTTSGTMSSILAIFVGIDEYQSIKRIANTQQFSSTPGVSSSADNNTQRSLVMTLLEKFMDIIYNPCPGVAVLPLLSGTDLDSVSVTGSSNVITQRLEMTLLTQSQMEVSLSSTNYGKQILELAPARRHLFYLGGVPRYFVEYSLLVGNTLKTDSTPPVKILDQHFNSVWDKYIQQGIPGLTIDQILLLIAYSLSGIKVNLSDTPYRDKLTWKRLRDMSLCLIGDNCQVILPYSILKCAVTINCNHCNTQAEKNLITCLQWLSERVDNVMFDCPPWNLWEKFGACFHALRINSLCVIGKKSIPFSQLCSGALVNGCSEEVNLKPVTIVESAEKYSEDLGEIVSMNLYPQKKVNWFKGDGENGYVVLNQTGGPGVDVFFSLMCTNKPDNYVICVDQRKREAASLGPKIANDYFQDENILPTFCKDQSILYRGLFSAFSSYKDTHSIPLNCFMVSYTNTQNYHSSLAIHPAASPCVNVNYDPISYLKLITSDRGASAIELRRITKKFENMNDLEKFLSDGINALKDKERIIF
jgi:hypothetical protein